MALLNKVVVLSTCLVLSLAQDYEYSINQDKVSFRQSPQPAIQAPRQPSFQGQSLGQPTFQTGRQPSFQGQSSGQPTFQTGRQPLSTAQLSKYNSIPQIKIDSQAPQQSGIHSNNYDDGQYHEVNNGQYQEVNSAPQFQSAPAPARFQGKPVALRPATGSTYVPVQQNSPSFAPAPQQNSYTQNSQSFSPPQNSFQSDEEFAAAPVQPAAPARAPVQSSFDAPATPVRRPAKRPNSASVAPLSSAPASQSADDLALIQEQNANAKYAFASNVENSINDNSLQRQEVRDGLALKGMYSYSDGFYKRTVHYEADENGYRIINESAEPIGDGPQLNLNGKAEVATDIDGTSHGYSITADDVVNLRKHKQQSPFKIVA